MTLEVKISKNNDKLKKDNIASFNLPAGISKSYKQLVELNKELVRRGKRKAFTKEYLEFRKTYKPEGIKICIGAGACFGICYAQQGTFNFIMSVVARELNLMNILMNNADFFMDTLIAVGNMQQDIRIHDSGDFFNQEYLDFWFAIAEATPDKIFYAYTKSLTLDFSAMPENMRITQSEGGLHDDKINKAQSHSRIFSSHKARIKAGYKNGNASDLLALNGVIKIGLVYHGGKNLTEKQEKYFA